MFHYQHRYAARLGALLFSVIALAACSNEPPGCADEKTLSLVANAFWDTVSKNAVNPDEKPLLAAARPNFRVSLEVPRVKAKQPDAGRLVCAGTLRVALTDTAAARVDKFFKRETASEVEYTSQLTADGKQHVVELAGHENPAEFVWGVAKMRALQPAPSSPAAGGAIPSTTADAMAPSASAPAAPPSASAPPPPALVTGEGSAPHAVAAKSAFDEADKALNDAYQAARAAVADQQKSVLRDDQRAWIKRRDATCGAGTEAEQLSCKAKLTMERTKELQAMR